jgi:hypothetical protein
VLDFQPNLQPLDASLNALRQDKALDEWAQLMIKEGTPLSPDYIQFFRQQESLAREQLLDLIHRLLRIQGARLMPPELIQLPELISEAAFAEMLYFLDRNPSFWDLEDRH